MRITTHHPELTESGLVRCEDGGLRPPWAAVSDELRHYYDTEWGAPVTDEAHIFERICLEGFQSGLSWQTILAKQPLLRKLFHGFDPDAVAKFTEADIERLMQVSGMIRNRRKIAAVIANAKATIELRKSGGLSHLVWSFRPAHHERPTTVAGIASTSPESTALAKELKRHGFQFVGPTTVYATMQAIGLVDDRVVGAAPLVRYGEHMSEKTAVVTGGSSGIGEAAARALAASDEDTGFQAVLCNPLAAKEYGLEVIAGGVADNPDAVTRFVKVTRPGRVGEPTGADKTTLLVQLPHDRSGALLDMLEQFSARGVNLSRIESRPVGDSLGRYRFSIDVEGHVREERVQAALIGLHRTCPVVRFLGSYPRLDARPTAVLAGTSDKDFVVARSWVADVLDGRAL